MTGPLRFWAFFNLCAIYVDRNIDTAPLYLDLQGIFGTWFANLFSHEEDGVRKVLGETISHTGYIIMILQVFVSKSIERMRALPSFMFGLLISAVGFVSPLQKRRMSNSAAPASRMCSGPMAKLISSPGPGRERP